MRLGMGPDGGGWRTRPRNSQMNSPSFLKYLLNAHSVSVVGIMLSARLQPRMKHVGLLSPSCSLS